MAYEILDPEFPEFDDLAITFGVMPIIAGSLARIAVRTPRSDRGSDIPIFRGDAGGLTIRLVEDMEDQRTMNRVEALLMLNGASVGKIKKANLESGSPIFTGVSETEAHAMVDEFARRGITASIDRDSLPK